MEHKLTRTANTKFKTNNKFKKEIEATSIIFMTFQSMEIT